MSNLNLNREKSVRQGRYWFDSKELSQVSQAVDWSEELVNNYFKLSSNQWLKNRYDIKTAKDLSSHELLDGPLAQVVKYEGNKKELPFGSSIFSFYKVCLQDSAILSAAENNHLPLDPLLVYVLTHELVHVVRFSKFEYRYENKNESDVTIEEERKVHRLTHDILKPISVTGLIQVFEFYRDWF